MRRWFDDFIHNAVVHPIMCFMPVNTANRFHDWHASKVFGQNRHDELGLEGRKK